VKRYATNFVVRWYTIVDFAVLGEPTVGFRNALIYIFCYDQLYAFLESGIWFREIGSRNARLQATIR
jgi:hypothetical protein